VLPTTIRRCRILNAECDILEGGKCALVDRERRYRLHWEQTVEGTVL
jgi:hypothetical protein